MVLSIFNVYSHQPYKKWETENEEIKKTNELKYLESTLELSGKSYYEIEKTTRKGAPESQAVLECHGLLILELQELQSLRRC